MAKRFLKYFALTFIVVIIVLLVWSRYNPGIGLGNGYRLIDVRPDNIHIIKDDKTVVLSSIVDYQESGNFVAGLRFPVNFLSCENGNVAIIKVVNREEFFLLNKQNGHLKNFNNKQVFEEELVELDSIDSDLFDYSKFEVIWEKYSKLYARSSVSNCELYPVGTKEYENSEKTSIMNKVAS